MNHLSLHVTKQLLFAADVDEESDKGHVPSIIPSCSRRRHTACHAPLQARPQAITETMSKKIGRIGDWNNGSQSGSDRSASSIHPFNLLPNTNNNTRRGPGEPRIATLRDATQPDLPARHHASDDEDDEESGRDQGESWFAGGERRLDLITSWTLLTVSLIRYLSSGISVENPGRPNFPGGSLVQDLLRRAAE